MSEEELRRYKLDNQSRQRARKQFWATHDHDSYECPDCGRRADHTDVDGFDVHHRDGDPRNNGRDNLVGLCRTCHYARHSRVYDPETVDEWEQRFREELLGDSNSDMRFIDSSDDRTALTDGGDSQ